MITQNWDFTRSHVYCGNETGRHVEHVSTCGRMAVSYIHLDTSEQGQFTCEYSVIPYDY